MLPIPKKTSFDTDAYYVEFLLSFKEKKVTIIEVEVLLIYFAFQVLMTLEPEIEYSA